MRWLLDVHSPRSAAHVRINYARRVGYVPYLLGFKSLFLPVPHPCQMRRETDSDSKKSLRLSLSLSWYQPVDTRIASHSPTNLRCRPFPRVVVLLSIPILLPPSKIRVRTPRHFTTLRKVLTNRRKCRASHCHAPRRGSCLLLPLHPFHLISPTPPN